MNVSLCLSFVLFRFFFVFFLFCVCVCSTHSSLLQLRVFDVRKPQLPLRLARHTHWIYDLAFNRFDDQQLLSADSTGKVKLFNVHSMSSSAAAIAVGRSLLSAFD